MEFTLVNIQWSEKTLIFYLGIIFLTYILSFSNNNVLKIDSKRINLSLFLNSVIFLFVKGFGTTGRDIGPRGGYYLNFLSGSSMKEYYDQSIEIGFRVLSVMIKVITDNYALFLFIVALGTIIPIMKIISKYKNELDVPLTIIFYTSIYFFASFSPIRQYLAASIGLLAFIAIIEEKPKKSLFLILFAISFHTSAILLLIPYVMYFIKVFNRKLVFVSLTAIFLLLYIEKNSLFSFFLSSDRYYKYAIGGTGFGFEQIAYYLPIFVLLYLGRKEVNKKLFRLSFIYVTTGFCFGMLSYIITIFGRLQPIFIAILFIAGHYAKIVKERYPKCRILITALFIAYCVLRFWIFISQYYNNEDLMPYTNIFNWII